MEKYLAKLTREKYKEHNSEELWALQQEHAHNQAVKNADAKHFIQDDLEQKHTQAAQAAKHKSAREQEIDIEPGHRNADGSLKEGR